MSNYYKSTNLKGSSKIIIKTKQIEMVDTSLQNQATDLESEEERLNSLINNKNQLEKEITSLTEKKEQLENEIAERLAATEQEISSWWTSKQQEIKQLSEQAKAEATQEGFQEGYNQGVQQALSEFEFKLGEAERIVHEAYAEKEKIIQEAEPFLLSLSVKIAEKIIRQELTQSESGLLTVIHDELAQIRDRGEITLQVPANEYQKLLPYKEELKSFVPAEIELKIVPDKSISQLDCLIHTPSGSYDLTMESQLKEIEKQLLSFYEERVT